MPIRWKILTERRESYMSICLPRKYIVRYPKAGEEVSAPKDTLGLMTFKTKKLAMKFDNCDCDCNKLVKVFGIGKGVVPDEICGDVDYLPAFYKRNYQSFDEPPDGTICYQRIKMLE